MWTLENSLPVSTRHQAIAALSQLVGLPLSAARRAADMRTLQFGALRQVERGSIGDFALHVQCPWRIEGSDGIMTGTLDLWCPAESGPESRAGDADPQTTPNLQDRQVDQLLATHGPSLVVSCVDADDYGGAAITFESGFVLRVFPAGTSGEDWRLFRPGHDGPHFVIAGGKVELEDDLAP